MNPNAVGHPLTATPAINEFTNLNVTGLATRKKARVEYNEYLNFNPSDLTPIYFYHTKVNVA
jgi:hypothetical protein